MSKANIQGPHPILKWALAGAIVIVLNLLFNYGLSVFYPAPDWDEYCGDVSAKSITTEVACTEVGGQWQEDGIRRPITETTEVTGYCDATFTCREAYEADRDVYSRNAFIVLVVLGVVALVVGTLIAMAPVVSLGLSYGGVLSLIIASMRYWGSADDIVRFLILVVALALLIWLGIRKFNK